MSKYLDSIKDISDFKKINIKNLNILSNEIRDFLIENISKTGGHLSSNLGIVELTIALHTVFNSPVDKFIFDVSHQSYVHKIITGRKDGFDTLKKKDGLSGFTNKKESIHDIFDVGHTSTSIALGLGMAVSRDLKEDKYNVISIIGDGALTGGEAFESLNNVGMYKGNLIIILNDNDMSISENTGMLSNHLKNLDSTNNFFTNLGIEYIGKIDGHDIEKLIDTLKKVKDIDHPVLIHVKTIKGKGYDPSEKDPTLYHATNKFDVINGSNKSKTDVSFTNAAAKSTLKLAKNKDVAVICPAMQHSLMLSEFEKKYKNRFFDTAIAEQHSMSFAAGLAENGIKPFVFMYSTFLQRAYDQIEQDICLNNLPVTMLIDRSGIVGEDGKTHQGIYDISFLSHIPNLVYMSPKDDIELSNMIEFSYKLNKPVAIRYPKGNADEIVIKKYNDLEIGKMEVVSREKNVAIIGLGNMYPLAEEVAIKIGATLINPRFICPLDKETLDSLKENHSLIVTIEDGILDGGFAEKISRYYGNDKIKTLHFGYPKEYIEHSTRKEILNKYGITKENILNSIDMYI